MSAKVSKKQLFNTFNPTTIMKKIFAIAAAAMLMVSCGENPADKMCKILDEGTARVEKAANGDEAEKIQNEVLEELSKFADSASFIDNIRFNDEGKAKVEEATQRLSKAVIDKMFNSATEELNKIGEDAKKQLEDIGAEAQKQIEDAAQ